jgi:hypothetical protein
MRDFPGLLFFSFAIRSASFCAYFAFLYSSLANLSVYLASRSAYFSLSFSYLSRSFASRYFYFFSF